MDLGLAIGLAVVFFLLGLVVGYLAFSDGQPKNTPAEPTKNQSQAILAENASQNPVLPSQPEADLRDQATIIQTKPTAAPSTPAGAAQTTQPAAGQAASETPAPLTFSGAISDMFMRQSPTRENATQQSIVGQIDKILQEKIDESYVRRGLRMAQMPDHSMGIILDNVTYGSIDSLPDETAKTMIREAVKEWTESQRQRGS